MKKLRIVILATVCILLVTVGIVFLIHKKDLTEKNIERKNKTALINEKISENAQFTFKMEELNSEFDYNVTMAQDGENVCIDMHSEGEHTATIVSDNESYYIMHDEKSYFILGDEPVDIDIEIYGIQNMINQQYKNGIEEIEGKKYYYEEFDNEELYFINHLDIDDNSHVKIRFYFNGDNLIYIKNIATNNKKVSEELIKTSLSYDIDENLFKIPKDYKEI